MTCGYLGPMSMDPLRQNRRILCLSRKLQLHVLRPNVQCASAGAVVSDDGAELEGLCPSDGTVCSAISCQFIRTRKPHFLIYVSKEFMAHPQNLWVVLGSGR
jgi:hypothetical protein